MSEQLKKMTRKEIEDFRGKFYSTIHGIGRQVKPLFEGFVCPASPREWALRGWIHIFPTDLVENIKPHWFFRALNGFSELGLRPGSNLLCHFYISWRQDKVVIDLKDKSIMGIVSEKIGEFAAIYGLKVIFKK